MAAKAKKGERILDWCERRGHEPICRFAFEIDGDTYIRDLCSCDLDSGVKLKKAPDWLDAPLRQWPHPQDPITYSGIVLPEGMDAAREFLGIA